MQSCLMSSNQLHEVSGSLVVIEADRLFDGRGFVEPARVAIEHGRIKGVGEVVTDPPTDALSGMTLLPGFVDCHQHLVFDGKGTLEEQVAPCSDDELLQRARANARLALEGGVTTLRDLGDRNFVTLGLRNDPSLPTILCSGPPITPPQGHCWYLNGECADRHALIAAINERAARGCDVVKIMATGGNLTPAAPAWKSQFSADDLRVAVEVAHGLGLPVAAHCHGVQGISDAVDAGVDTIEHCSFTSEDPSLQPDRGLLERVAKSGIALSATFGRCPDVPIQLPPGGIPAWITSMFESISRVHELGARIVVGTDAGIAPHKPHDVAPHAIDALLRIGMTPIEALTALTSGGADAIGLANKGRITPGADADMIAVEGDLSSEVRDVANVAYVWREGELIRR
jgi:imidazolonepropionase-like amidohydrolase